MRCLLIFLVSSIALTLTADAQAEIVFGFSAVKSPLRNQFVEARPDVAGASSTMDVIGEVGDIFRINIFMLEQGAAESRIMEFGVVSTGIVASTTPDAGKGEILGVVGTSLPVISFDGGVQGPPVYQFGATSGFTGFDNGAGTVTFAGGADLGSDAGGAKPAPGLGTESVFIGYFDYQINGEGVANFAIGDENPNAGFSNNTIGGMGGDDLDLELFVSSPSFTIGTVSTIPEPGSLAFLAGVGVIAAVRRRRRA